MAYVEFLRARRVLLWYFGIVIGLYLIGQISGLVANGAHGHVGFTIDVGPDPVPGSSPAPHHSKSELPQLPLPISILEYATTFGAILVAAILGSALNRQRENLALAWTRPVSRERFALRVFAVDALAIAVTLGGTMLFCAVTTLRANAHFAWYADAFALTTLALGFGAALMTYALVAALTSWNLASGGLVSGLSLVGCAVLLGLGSGRVPRPYDALVGALNYLNPLAYYGPVNIYDKHGPMVFEFARYLPLEPGVKIACVWFLAAAYLAVAAYGWKRLEI
jgi:hypothetical protein